MKIYNKNTHEILTKAAIWKYRHKIRQKSFLTSLNYPKFTFCIIACMCQCVPHKAYFPSIGQFSVCREYNEPFVNSTNISQTKGLLFHTALRIILSFPCSARYIIRFHIYNLVIVFTWIIWYNYVDTKIPFI